MGKGAPTLDRPPHVLRPRALLVFVCIGAAAWFVYDARPADNTIEAKFGFAGVPETYVVPAGICRIRIEAVGAAGGSAGTAGTTFSAGIGAGFGWATISYDRENDACRTTPRKGDPAARAAETAFYRRAAERTARLVGKPVPKWRVCPRCELAFHGPDTVPENPATGHTPGDWQP
jgi:hypothetical protein